MDVDGIARVCHEANRAYCQSIGDPSKKPWEEESDELRASCMDGVLTIADDPDVTPERLHEKWWDKKKLEGWGYAVVKNEELKQHPCCISYGYLPRPQRIKDELFHAVARALLR